MQHLSVFAGFALRRVLLSLALVTPVALAGCGGDSTDNATPAGSPTVGMLRAYTEDGTFAAAGAGQRAITYDPSLVPVGATAEVTVSPDTESTTIQLNVNGLKPGRGYGAHLHTKACGADGTAAGPHFQHDADPAAVNSPPSVDPSYANSRNEVWLDFTTEQTGAATATATVPWLFDPIVPPRSLVIHAETTMTAPGRAGMAGARLACLTLPA